MEDKLQNKMKKYLPYIIVIGAVFLIVPALLLTGSDFVSYLVLIGVLPLTALLSCAYYSMNKENDFFVSLIAPVFFLPAMFIYGIAQTDFLRAFIYLIAYFLCGYLGLTIGDILANRKSGDKDGGRRPVSASGRTSADRSVRRTEAPEGYRTASARRSEPVIEDDEPVAPVVVPRPAASTRARRVAVDVTEEPQRFETEDPYEDRSLDLSTTGDDIDAILREIHQRHGNE